MQKIKAGIIGGAGYTGGELLRLLLLHPAVEIAFVQSESQAGKPVSAIHADLLGETNLQFSAVHHSDVDVLFLCGGHGAARTFLTNNDLPPEVVVIDLSHDFRHKANCNISNRTFVYGLAELNREQIKRADSVANAGCFATAIQLALLPLAAKGELNAEIHVNATTGSTGAGQSLSATSHFSWRSNNQSVYKAFEHQHLQEIGESLQSLQPGFEGEILFVPQRGAFTRGILASVYLTTALSLEELNTIYRNFYATHPFVVISDKEVDVKQVVNTNRCFLHLAKHGSRVLVTSVIDNLLKGACGQAVQHMNLIFGLDETTGLKLKPSAF